MLPNNSTFAPILTPFDESGENIDFAAFAQHLEFLANAGINGVLVLGTNGEFAHLSAAEKIKRRSSLTDIDNWTLGEAEDGRGGERVEFIPAWPAIYAQQVLDVYI